MPTIATREPEQLSLFDLFVSNAGREQANAKTILTIQSNAVTSAPSRPVAAKPVKAKPLTVKERISIISSEPAYAAFSQKLQDVINNNDFKALLDYLNIDIFNVNREERIYGRFNGSHYAAWSCTSEDRLHFTRREWDDRCRAVTFRSTQEYRRHATDSLMELHLNIAYVSEATAEVIITPVSVRVSVYNNDFGNIVGATGKIDKISSEKIFIPTKFVRDVCYFQAEGKLHQIILSTRPYIKDWLLQNADFSLKRYLVAPWLEILSKAGFDSVASRFLCPAQYIDDKVIDNLNRLCGPGTKPKDIFKCSKTVYTVLKDESDLQIWDTIRRLDKKDQITGDSILMVYQMGLRPKELDTLNSILGIKINNKPVFTVASLINYLNRLDMYEAISTREALPLLNDYLHMCYSLNMPPRVDGDSLKREHDIASRLIREKRNRDAEEKMRKRREQEQREIEEGNSKLARAEYHENIYFVRPITEYNDLLDEAIQQDNCVASYADRIATGQSRIFTMRETAHPERSLVTIELSPDCKTIRQKALAHNQQIRSRAMSEFIERWHRQLNAAV